MQEEKRFAVLIDADNVTAKYIKIILDEISNYGVATYKRIYGDWTKPSSWKDILLENSITPVQQYNYTQGKNATDSAMIIDAMDILYSNNVEGFCIVSSDSDFTKLSSRLRESGMVVVGMGEEKTPKPFISSCNQFKYLDVIAASENDNLSIDNDTDSKGKVVKQSKTNESEPSKTDEKVKNMTDIKVIENTIIKMMNAKDQSMNIGELGSRLIKRYPDFDVRNYGYKKLSKFLTQFDFLETQIKGTNGIWVSLKTGVKQSHSKPHIKAAKKKRRSKKKKS